MHYVMNILSISLSKTPYILFDMYALLEKLDRDCIDFCFILWCTFIVVHYNFVHVFGKLYETIGNVASHLFITTTIFVIG